MLTPRATTSRTLPARARRLGLVALTALVLAGCGGGDTAPVPQPQPLPSDQLPPFSTAAVITSLDGLTAEIELAIADAAERFGVDPMEVAVAGALRVTWSNGAIGCPEDGMMYTEALVEGYLLTLEVDGVRHAYHGAEGDDPFLCPRD